MMYTRIAALAGVLVLAGCATAPGANSPSPSESGIAVTGTVFASPGCGGPQRLDAPCPDKPVPGAQVQLAAGGRTAATTTTDAQGRFRVVVPAGDYRITAHNVGYASQASKDISVTGPLDLTLTVDSGLR